MGPGPPGIIGGGPFGIPIIGGGPRGGPPIIVGGPISMGGGPPLIIGIGGGPPRRGGRSSVEWHGITGITCCRYHIHILSCIRTSPSQNDSK